MKTKVNDIMVVLDNIRSRENVGSIFRTADAAGVNKIYLCGITPAPNIGNPKQIKNSDKIAKTALGAETWVPWEYHAQTWNVLRKLKVDPPAGGVKLKVIGLEQTINSKNIFKYKNNRPTKSGESRPKGAEKIALVLGNEVKGLSPRILKYCDVAVSIPMYGKKESLNVAVAAGIALYQILR